MKSKKTKQQNTMSTALELIQQSGDIQILPDNSQWKNRFEIKSESSNRLYIIAQNKKTEKFSCSCFGHIRYKKCKHITAFQPLLDSLTQEQKQLK